METAKYEVNSINKVLDMLNNLTVTGINNAHAIVEITKILQNPIDDRNREPAIKPVEDVVTEADYHEVN